MKTNAIIIPVAAGKGGVGKSLLAANLAIALAELGHRTIAVDLDLGASNLHSFLGLPNRYPGIGDFLKARSAELEELLVATQTTNLRLLPGDGKTPFMANIPYAQKQKLISHMRKLPADYILVDLGAGSSFNVLDFFRISPRGIVITTPEQPAVMSMLVFLKNFLLRAIVRTLARSYPIRTMLREMHKLPMKQQISSVEALHHKIAGLDQEAGEAVLDVYRSFRPRVVFNMGEHPDDLNITSQISKTLRSILSLEVDYFGFVFYDSAIKEAVRSRAVFLPEHRDSLAAKNIVRIAERITKYWNMPVEDSAGRLLKHVAKIYESSMELPIAAGQQLTIR
ncbi:MAG: P-loop NTPase [Deltaproteobacteria bacterium]|nr:P-loop NTPase [Deltaproteobacteria bacterium]MBW2341658.1 P-loop NTPase [Deltaproteobacteria bacterium]